MSIKGVSRRTNDFVYDHFEKMVKGNEGDPAVLYGTNKGLTMVRGEIKQYEQKKVALTSIYVKRVVQPPDGRKTIPLDL
jgi:hypothetical protein